MQALLGHAHVDTTARYIHLAPTHVKAEFDAARDRQRAPAAEPERESPAFVLAAYAAHQSLTGRGNTAYDSAARSFLRRWAHVQTWAEVPLERQLTANSATRPFITFLMVSRRLRPGYDYLLARKLSSFWRDLTGSALQGDLDRFVSAARELGFSERVGSAIASQVVARLLIQTGSGLGELTAADFTEFDAAGKQREQRTGRTWRHYRVTSHSARQAGAVPPRHPGQPQSAYARPAVARAADG